MLYTSTIWFIASIIVGIAAGKRGRGSGNWFILSLIISPLLSALLLLVQPDLSKDAGATIDPVRKCPKCAETILAAASVCKHCGHDVEPDRAAVEQAERIQRHTALQAQQAKQLRLMVLAASVVGLAIAIYARG